MLVNAGISAIQKKVLGMKSNLIFFAFVIPISIIGLTSCNPHDSESFSTSVKGVVQKGPFISGSSVMAFTLKDDLSQTGMSYNTQIADNNGAFDLGTLKLSSDYVCLRADGFYFNEISGKQSASQITLYALSDVRDKENINVNILTHLEKPRIEYLMDKGESFNDAKKHAQADLLALFGIVKSDVTVSEEMNICQGGDDNAILLAISSIIQGFRTESQLTELLSEIGSDLKTDGTLDSPELNAALVNHAFYIDTTDVKENLKALYDKTGETTKIPSFGKYITGFLSGKAPSSNVLLAGYPETGIYGKNVLSLTETEYKPGIENPNSIAAVIPSNVSLKVVLRSLTYDTINATASDSAGLSHTLVPHVWYYEVGTPYNWAVSEFNSAISEQTFTSLGSGVNCDLRIFFEKGSYQVDYFEMNATIPTRRKIITVN